MDVPNYILHNHLYNRNLPYILKRTINRIIFPRLKPPSIIYPCLITFNTRLDFNVKSSNTRKGVKGFTLVLHFQTEIPFIPTSTKNIKEFHRARLEEFHLSQINKPLSKQTLPNDSSL